MAEVLTPDICVIGAGAGGLMIAGAAGAIGASVVLIEKNKMGGDQLHYGTVPATALLAAAQRAHDSATAGPLGIDAKPRIDFARVQAHVRRTIAAVAPNVAKERFGGSGVQIVSGTGSFVARDRVAVDGITEVRAPTFVIATGSAPAIPPIPGLDETPFVTNETVFDLPAVPTHLVVLGGGPIGLEFAQAFRRLGAAVTIIEAGRLLGAEDPECAAIVADALALEGIAIRDGTAVTSIKESADGILIAVTVREATETIMASHLLVASGRVPRIAGLGLDKAHIKQADGGIVVNARLRTSNRRVYAIGDVAGAMMSAHIAEYHAGIVIREVLFRSPAKVRYDAIPWVTFTDPQIARVGLSDAEAKAKGYDIHVLRWSYHDNDRAQADRRTRGHVKVVTGRLGRILGATIVGAHAGEMIGAWALAIEHGIDIGGMAQVAVPYPTFGEINKRAALSFFAPGAAHTRKRRLTGWLNRKG